MVIHLVGVLLVQGHLATLVVLPALGAATEAAYFMLDQAACGVVAVARPVVTILRVAGLRVTEGVQAGVYAQRLVEAGYGDCGLRQAVGCAEALAAVGPAQQVAQGGVDEEALPVLRDEHGAAFCPGGAELLRPLVHGQLHLRQQLGHPPGDDDAVAGQTVPVQAV